MPFYELFCLGRSGLARAEKADLFRQACQTILGHGGVLTDLKSFGDRQLAYKVSRAGGIYSEAFTYQVSFAAKPTILQDIENALKLDERVLRHMLIKTEPFKPFPSAHAVSKAASKKLGTSV